MATVTRVTATYTKLRSGAWGIRVPGNAYVGQTYTVVKRNGVRNIETVHAVVYRGNGVSLCSIAPARAARPAPRPQPRPTPQPSPVVTGNDGFGNDVFDGPDLPDHDPYQPDDEFYHDADPREAFDYDGFGNDVTF